MGKKEDYRKEYQMLKCPNCNYIGTSFQTERRPNGYTTCLDCGHNDLTRLFVIKTDDEIASLNPAKVGMVLYGYCNGFFGRESYLPKTIEAVGKDWILVRHDDGKVDFLQDEGVVKDIPVAWLSDSDE